MDYSLLERRTSRCADDRPSLFRLANREDEASVERLLAEDPALCVFDTFLEQLGELVETRNPSCTFSKEQRVSEVTSYLAGRNQAVLGVWVHYPWSRRLVHLLDEVDFVELRTNRNRYKITPEEQATLATKRVGVVGLSVGQSVALTMAMERALGELRIADFDTLGLSNLNRIRAGVHALGIPKTTMVTREISELDPFLSVRSFPAGLTDATMEAFLFEGGKLDVLIDECDDLTVKLLLRARAREAGIPVVMDTSDRGLIDVERFDREPTRPIFHGLVGDLDPEKLRGLSTEDKVPYVLRIIGESTVSSRMIASLLEVGESIKTWPQLASSVVLGGAVTCDVVRRMLLGQFTDSGRYFVDLEALVGNEPRDARPAEEISAAPRAAMAANETVIVQPEREEIITVVRAAASAPSGGNCQPWSFVAEGNRLWVCHDRERSTSLLDYGDCAAMLALGAATENAVLTAHRLGLRVAISAPVASATVPGAVAVLELHADASSESHAFDSLADFIGVRCTNRKLGTRGSLAPEAAVALRAAGESFPDITLHLLESERDLSQIGSILGSGDRVRFLNEQLHREMMSEMRWSKEEAERTADGIDVETLELSAADRAGVQLCRSWPAMQLVSRVGGGFALQNGSKKAVRCASAVGLLVARESEPIDYFRGGRALQRLWLTATSLGLAFQPMSSLPYLFARLVRGGGVGLPAQQSKELRALRKEYEALFPLSPRTAELMLFRLSVAGPPSAVALRRPVEAVLRFL